MTPFGDRAVRFPIPAGTPKRRLFAVLSAIRGVVDVVLGESVGCVVFEEGADRSLALVELARPIDARDDVPVVRHVVEVVYDGEDLDAVAQSIGKSREDVVRLHTSRDYQVAMMGFLPGFAYLRGLPEELCLPRRAPRPRVPPGSVAIAGGYGGIYPFASPGGWHLLGRASSFEAFADDRAFLSLGDTVRFAQTSHEPRKAIGDIPAERAVPSGPHLEIVRAAGLGLLVDGGRPGRMHEGIPHGGPLVRALFARANQLVGNPLSACAIEITGTFEVVAISGEVVIADDDRRVVLAEGERHVVSTSRRERVRYLAIAGGIDAPVRLGGRGALLVAGIGQPIKKGDRFGSAGAPSGQRPITPRIVESDAVPFVAGPDVVPGFSSESLASAELRISSSSNRVGTRLEGTTFEVTASALSLPSAPMVKGAIELTPSGLIVFGPDHPTTGGYPVVAVVCERGLDTLFARPLGASVRFEAAEKT